MKKINFIYILLILLAMSACTKQSDIALYPDFSVTVTGVSPNAILNIVNKSTGATDYQWTFGEGASVSTSTDKEPANIKIDKAGTLSIVLAVKNGDSQKTKASSVVIGGNHAMVTFTGVEFALKASDATYGRFFSTETGLIYKDNEVNATNGPKIDLAFLSLSATNNYFTSPNSPQFTIPYATTSLVRHFINNEIAVTDFETIKDDVLIKNTSITTDNKPFGSTGYPLLVLFQNSKGKKGVIKVREINASRLLVDIKIQKYNYK